MIQSMDSPVSTTLNGTYEQDEGSEPCGMIAATYVLNSLLFEAIPMPCSSKLNSYATVGIYRSVCFFWRSQSGLSTGCCERVLMIIQFLKILQVLIVCTTGGWTMCVFQMEVVDALIISLDSVCYRFVCVVLIIACAASRKILSMNDHRTNIPER